MGKISKWVLGAGFALASSIIMVNEGVNKRADGPHHAYQDGAGVWTICYGETKGVKKGMTKTDAECEIQLRESITSHASPLYNLPDSTPKVVVLGSLDFAYNAGVSGFNNSTIKRYLLKGDYENAGKAILAWRYISKSQKRSPGVGWKWNSSLGKWRFDCSQYINSKPNQVCYGVWKRRLIQSDMIGNRISVEEALRRLNDL